LALSHKNVLVRQVKRMATSKLLSASQVLALQLSRIGHKNALKTPTTNSSQMFSR
ncbi:hypothetical protein RvY_17559, partial [Ramazzottius varieornatus]